MFPTELTLAKMYDKCIYKFVFYIFMFLYIMPSSTHGCTIDDGHERHPVWYQADMRRGGAVGG
jgi:hypothetical protein